jgi:hypothetical protein
VLLDVVVLQVAVQLRVVVVLQQWLRLLLLNFLLGLFLLVDDHERLLDVLWPDPDQLLDLLDDRRFLSLRFWEAQVDVESVEYALRRVVLLGLAGVG